MFTAPLDGIRNLIAEQRTEQDSGHYPAGRLAERSVNDRGGSASVHRLANLWPTSTPAVIRWAD